MIEVREGTTEEWFVAPDDLGLARARLEEIAGGSPEENAAVVRGVLEGSEQGPARDVVLANAGAAILAAGGAEDIAAGVAKARDVLASGAANDVLSRPHRPDEPSSLCRRMSRLDELVDAARRTVGERSRAVPLEELRGRLEARGEDRPFKEALVRPGLSIIAEFKRRSPSAGEIRPGAEIGDIVTAYERGGAAAVSILTEDGAFGGALEDLAAARSACDLPLLRKDFVVDPYQLVEAAVYGADAVLLIVAALEPGDLARLRQEAEGLDLDTVVEVHDEEELEVALDLDVDVIGINNRDLGDLRVDIATTARLITDVPAGQTVVAESGYSSRDQLDELERIGVDAVLIGEALMRAPDPEQAVRELAGDEHVTREHEISG